MYFSAPWTALSSARFSQELEVTLIGNSPYHFLSIWSASLISDDKTNRYNDAVWVATSYLISYTALQPLCKSRLRFYCVLWLQDFNRDHPCHSPPPNHIRRFLDGRISDAIGRKNTLLFASSTFFIGSLLCGAAPNFWFLVAARVVAGIGGGGMNTMSSIVTSDLVSLRDRGK